MTFKDSQLVELVGWAIAAYCAVQTARQWWRSHDGAIRKTLRMVEPWHLQLIGVAGIILSAFLVLAGLLWEWRRPKSSADMFPTVVTRAVSAQPVKQVLAEPKPKRWG